MQDKTGYRTIAGTCVAWVIAAAMSYPSPAQAQSGVPQNSGVPKLSGVPKYEVDPLWAKLPDNWVVGPLGGACIDARDHVFVLHRQEGLTEEMVTARDRFDGAKDGGKTRVKAPPVMEFDPEGNLVNSWGDAKVLGNYLHDCQVDKDGNVWIAPARSGFVQKYSHDGKLLLQIGKSGVFDSSDGTAKGKPLNSDAAQFFGPSAVDVDPQNGDVYVADGHGGGNTRIAVLDKNGTFLRQFRLHHTEAEKNIEVLPHCMRLSNDGLVYVCDRQANRLQAFDKMGNFKRNIEIPWKNYTAENEDLRKYCHTAWRTFPPCTLVQKIGRGNFGGFGRVFSRSGSAAHLCRQPEPEGSRHPGSRDRGGGVDDRPRRRAFLPGPTVRCHSCRRRFQRQCLCCRGRRPQASEIQSCRSVTPSAGRGEAAGPRQCGRPELRPCGRAKDSSANNRFSFRPLSRLRGRVREGALPRHRLATRAPSPTLPRKRERE
jgi:sugar lactone lactonase YvrE